MILEHFTAADIPAAAALSRLTWGGEMSVPNKALQRTIYEAMVRCYFRSEALSFKMTDAEGLQGFLLAGRIEDEEQSAAWLKQKLPNFTAAEQSLLTGYLQYLHYNGEKVRQQAAAGDVLLGLFVSRQRGVGSALLQQAELAAAQSFASAVHLWADATCDYAYYRRRGYEAAGTFVNHILPQLGAQKTWIYSKKL